MRNSIAGVALSLALLLPGLALAQSAGPLTVTTKITRDLGAGNYALAGTKGTVIRSDRKAGTILVSLPVVTPYGITTWEVEYLADQLTGS